MARVRSTQMCHAPEWAVDLMDRPSLGVRSLQSAVNVGARFSALLGFVTSWGWRSSSHPWTLGSEARVLYGD